MKTYIHKKLGWKAVQHTSPEYYKVYKSEAEDCYTLRSSLEIEDSEDWKREESGLSTPPAETKEPTRTFTSTEDAELMATLENKIDELSNKLEILLKFESNVFTLLENHTKEKQKRWEK